MNDQMGRRVPIRIRVGVGLTFAVWLAAAVTARAQEGLSHAEDPALSKQLERIDQDKLLSGEYSLRQVIENGRHLFTTPFTKADGYGEGGRPDGKGGVELGPREELFRQNLEKFRVQTKSGLTVDQLRQFLNFPVPDVNKDTGKIVYPYLRLNGLDSQSCFECHNTIGSERLPDTLSYALTRKQSTVGGPAGFASNAFINENLPNPIFMFIRNPPHVFGTGYAQELAEEMTLDLLGLRSAALQQLLGSQPNIGSVGVNLRTKNIDFGYFHVGYQDGVHHNFDLKTVIDFLDEHPGQNPPGLYIWWEKIQGVSPDLVVRPFQWKGIASDERNFVRDATTFHFGMQAREKNPGFNTKEEDHDSDKDGIPDELSVGDVSALTIYTTTIRPPFEVQPRTDDERQAVARGRKIFQGQEVVTNQVSCAVPHPLAPPERLDDRRPGPAQGQREVRAGAVGRQRDRPVGPGQVERPAPCRPPLPGPQPGCDHQGEPGRQIGPRCPAAGAHPIRAVFLPPAS